MNETGTPNHEQLEFDREMHNLISSVDFETLRSILADFYRRSGGKPDTMNFVPPERIMAQNDLGDRRMLYYEGVENRITFSVNDFQQYSREHPNAPIDENFRLSLVHEEVHASSRSSDANPETATETNPMRTGYSESFPGMSPLRANFETLNEGVTEKHARTVCRQYLERLHGKNSAQVKEFDEYLESNREMLPRQLEVTFIEFLCDRISETAGVDRGVVWQAFVRGMYEGKGLELEVIKFIRDAIPEYEGNIILATSVNMFTEDVFTSVIQKNPDKWRAFVDRVFSGIEPTIATERQDEGWDIL